MRNRNAAFKLPSKTTPIYAEEMCDMRTLLNYAKSAAGDKRNVRQQARCVCVSATARPVAEYRSRLVVAAAGWIYREAGETVTTTMMTPPSTIDRRPRPATHGPGTRDSEHDSGHQRPERL